MITQTKEVILPKPHQTELIDRSLVGYWADNIWDWQGCPINENSPGTKPRVSKLRFARVSNRALRNEIKYYYFYKLENYYYKPSYAWNNNPYLQNVISFISEYYKHASSILEIPYDKSLLQYRTWLRDRNLKTTTRKKKVERKNNDVVYQRSLHISIYGLIYEFYRQFYDEREEIEKDIWDVRKLGLYFNKTNNDYTINFSNTPSPFRPLLKKYINERVIILHHITFITGTNAVAFLQIFLQFVNQEHPDWDELRELSRQDILNFLFHLRITKNGQGKQRSDYNVRQYFSFIQTFLDYIQSNEWEEAPIKNVRTLIQKDDYPKENRPSAETVKFIPDSVWNQLIQKLDRLPAKYVPIIILMEATGFRVSDVLQLNIECLDFHNGGWWIVGDQRKVRYKDHKVPVSNEVAAIVKAQQEYLKSISNLSTINKGNYLFPNLEGKGDLYGEPYKSESLQVSLNKLAKEHNITDQTGKIYWFNNHAFRHRYGVVLINNGMSILHVQKLMAHASPEMTLIYAKLQDDTLMNEWNKARQKALRLSPDGELIPVNLEEQAEENGVAFEWIRHHLQAARLDHGYCIKPEKMNCDYLHQAMEPPCIKNNCKSFHVDTTFIDYYQTKINQLEKDKQTYEKTGRTRQIEFVKTQIEKFRNVLEALLNKGGIYGIPKSKREYRS